MRIVELIIWAILVVAVTVTAIVAHIRGHRLSDVVASLRSRPIGALLLAVGWAWVGWHFLVR